MQIAYILAATVRAILVVLELLMLGRALISWLPLPEDSFFITFILLSVLSAIL